MSPDIVRPAGATVAATRSGHPTGIRPVGAEINAHVNAVFAAAQRAGAEELTDLIRARVAVQKARCPAVVVVGETKRGKSSLVNALLAWPGLSPVDADVATNTFVQFHHAEEPRAWVHRVDDETLEIEVHEIDQWAAASANPANSETVSWVDVGVPSPVLAEMTLVDTPGVGGLISGHAEMALEAVANAAALLFVLDAGAPLSQPELRFLERAAERIETVIFAMTKVDIFRGWRTVKATDEALLALHAPRFSGAPIIGVSPALALQALDDGLSPERAAKRLAESKLGELEATLVTRVARRGDLLHLANTLRLTDHVLAALERTAREQVGAVVGDPDLRLAAEREQARLAKLAEDGASWGPNLRHQMTALRISANTQLRNNVTELRRRYEEMISSVPNAALESIPADVAAGFTALAERTLASLVDRLSSIAATMLGELVSSTELPALLDQLADAPSVALSGRLPIGGRRPTPDAIDRLHTLATGGFSSGVNLVGVLATLLTGASALPPALMVLSGIGVLYISHKVGDRRQVRAELLVWARDELSQAQGNLQSELDGRLNDAQEGFDSAMRHHISRRSEELRRTLETHKRALSEDQATRAQARRVAEASVSALASLMTRNQDLLATLSTARLASPASAALATGSVDRD